MATELAPNPRETQEFQFKLLARLRLFRENPQLPLKQSLNLVASASKFGLIFVGNSTGFDVIQTARIVEQCAGVKKPLAEVTDFPRRTVTLGVQPTHLDVSCDCQHLAVASAGVIHIYDVTSFTSQTEKVVHDVRVMSAVQALSWNPGIINMLAAVLQDGSAAVYEFKNNTFEISSIPQEAQATCLCWSPKGKQIVIGSRNGALNQFKPELKIVKAIPPPQGDWSLVSVHWLSNFQYAAVYSPQGQHRPSLVVINTPKNPPTITYINYDDITYSNGDNRINQFYFLHQQTWNVLLVASANSMEVGVLGRLGEGPWEQWQMEDAARAELPLSSSRMETHPVGMAMDTSPQYNLPWGENQQLPPMPLLLLLSHEGLLTLYWCVNLQAGSPGVCVPPSPLPDTSGLHLFTSVGQPSQYEQVSPAQQLTPVSQQVTPLQQLTPVQQQLALVQQQLTPVSQQVTPLQQQLTPVQQQLALVQQQLTPVPQQGTPLQQQLTPVQQQLAPLQQQLTSVQQQQSPQKSQHVPVQTPPAFLTSTAVSFAPPAAASTPASAFLTSTASVSFAPPVVASTPAAALTYGAVTLAPTGQWQQPPATSQPVWSLPALSAAQSDGKFTSSWMSSPTVPPAFVASSTPTSAFSAAAVVSSANTAFATQPASFGPTESFGKPVGAFVQSSAPVTSKSTVPAVIPAAPIQVPAALEIPAASFPVQLPPNIPSTPEPEVTEESEQLREMNEALIQDSIREEINFCSKEIHQLSQRVHNLNVNVLNEAAVEKVMADTEEMLAFMKDLKETTEAQGAEVAHLRNFILQSFSYLESMKTRLRLQDNADYVSIQGSDGLDPIQTRRMIDIRTNIKFIDGQLSKLNDELVERWGIFQESNKENRELLHIPSLEAIYQAMVMQNSIMSKQKALIDQLEVKAKLRDRKRVLGLLNASKMVDGIEAEPKETDVSKMADDFLSLNLKKLIKSVTTVEELQEYVADVSLSNFEITPEQNVLLQQLFTDSSIKHLDYNKIWSAPTVTLPKSPRVAATVKTSTITSESPRTWNVVDDVKLSSSVGEKKPSPVKQPIKTVEDPKHKLPLTMSSSASTAASFSPLQNQPLTASSSFGVTPTQAPSSDSVGGHTPSSSDAPAAWICSSCKSPGGLNSPKVSQPISTHSNSNQPIFAPQTTTATKPFSFAPLGPSQTTSPFSSQPSTFGANTSLSQPVSTTSQPFVMFSKSFTFTTTAPVTTIAPTAFSSSFSKTETPKSLSPSSLASTPFKSAASESGFGLNASASPSAVPSNPLASLTSLVSGIEPLKPAKESPVKGPGSTEITKPAASQPFLFKDNKTSPVKDTVIVPQKNTGFSFTMEDKQESKDGGSGGSFIENKSQFSGAFKKLSFESGQSKSIFGSTSVPVSVISESGKSNQHPKNAFSFSSTTSSSLFSTSAPANISAQNKKSIVVASTTASSSATPVMQVKPIETTQTEDVESETTSPVIEICLTPPKGVKDSKTTLEKLVSSKGITITKVESPEVKSTSEESQTERDETPSTVFELSSFITPTKSTSNIFGGSSQSKPLVTYEVSKLDLESAQESVVDKNLESGKETDTSKLQSAFAGLTATASTPATSFSFSPSVLQPTETTQPSTGFTFGLKTPATTSNSMNSTTTTALSTSTFSLAPATTTPASTSVAFNFNLSSTSSTTSASSSFGLGNLSLALSADDKTKSAFSFGQQTQTPVTTSTSIFGGFGGKTSETSVFGQSPSAPASGENKSIFGQTPASAGETKNVFGQTPSSTSETKTVFGQTPSSTSETKSIFGQTPSSTSETKSIFGQTPSNTSETKSIFGQTLSSTGETKSIFGQTPANTNETKTIFGNAANTADTKSIFGQTENKRVFGQSPATSAEAKPEFSFSLSTQGTGGQTSFFGTPATTSTTFFGQQICSPTSTASSPFGQPATTPSVFGSPGPSPFGSTSTFGQSGASAFGGQSSGFGSSGGSMFGGGFGSPQPASPFGSSSGGSSSIFGGGSFSSGGQSVGQTGFGTSAFQSKPAFGSTSPQPAFGASPAFGAAPTFGGSPAFGSPPKLFGSPAAPAPAFGNPQQQSSTFENLASQNTMTFGNLAQNQAPAFGGSTGGGSIFGGAQQQQPATPAFAPATTSSTFGGSSFTSWR